MKEVLIVEDDEDMSVLIEELLHRLGFKTIVLFESQEVLKYCQNHRPDLILMDLSLPDIDGIELTHLIRRTDDQVPIIALSAHRFKDTKKGFEEAGFNDYLGKPFHPQDLISIVNQYI